MAVLPLSSNWTVIINTIFFEVVLANILYYLTADVCARLNYLSLIDGSVQQLFVQSPPLLSGGIISTNRRRTMLMIAVRAFGIALILGTALTIDGDSQITDESLVKQVRTAAPLSNQTTREDALQLLKLRVSCIVSENDTIIFGRLDLDNYCETNSSFLTESVSIHVPLNTMNFSVSAGCTNSVSNVSNSRQIMTTRCEQGEKKAVVACYLDGIFGNSTKPADCIGTFIEDKSSSFACDVFQGNFNESSLNISHSCHRAKNLNNIQSMWVSALEPTSSIAIIDLLGVTSLAGEEERKVKRNVTIYITRVHRMWVLCFALKIFVICILAIVSIWLRLKKTRRVLHDDQALLLLLRKRLSSWMSTSVNSDQAIYLRIGRRDTRNDVWASSLPNYNATSMSNEQEEEASLAQPETAENDHQIT